MTVCVVRLTHTVTWLCVDTGQPAICGNAAVRVIWARQYRAVSPAFTQRHSLTADSQLQIHSMETLPATPYWQTSHEHHSRFDWETQIYQHTNKQNVSDDLTWFSTWTELMKVNKCIVYHYNILSVFLTCITLTHSFFCFFIIHVHISLDAGMFSWHHTPRRCLLMHISQ